MNTTRNTGATGRGCVPSWRALGRIFTRRFAIASGAVFACLVLPPSGWAATNVLTFEGLQNNERILQFYNGGAGSLGSIGPDFDIEFGADALALRDSDSGGGGNFANEPSPDTIAFFLSGPGVVMNVPGGFQDGFSFYYSALGGASVTVYDGLDGTGNVLATLPLAENYNHGCTGDPTGAYCNWDPVGVTFAGTARSVSFAGSANFVGFDEITLGSDTPGDPVNTAPVADASGPYGGAEGSPIAIDGSSSSDADGDTLTYAWSVTADAGNDAGSDCTIADPSAAQTTITCNDDGSYTATLTVSDGTETDSDTAAVTVSNVAPEIGDSVITGNSGTACIAGKTVTLSFDVDDASALDEADLTGSVDWGDGTVEPYSGTSFSGSHTYAPGTYTITASADDHDGGTDIETFSVQHLYATSGLLAPINSDGSSNFKLGSTVPIKVQVRDCDGVLVSTLTLDVDLERIDTTPSGSVNEVVSSASADIGDDMRWATDQYIYNLSTKRSQFCQTGLPFCSNGNLTQGTYRATVTDAALNDAFAPIVGTFDIKQ